MKTSVSISQETIITKFKEIIIENIETVFYDDIDYSEMMTDRVDKAITLKELAWICIDCGWDLEHFCDTLVKILGFGSEHHFPVHGWST